MVIPLDTIWYHHNLDRHKDGIFKEKYGAVQVCFGEVVLLCSLMSLMPVFNIPYLQVHLLTHGSSKPLEVPNQISSPVKPSAPQVDYDQITKKDDVVSSSNSMVTSFHTANQSPNLYPTLSNASQQPSEVSRKRRSTSVSSSEGKKACVAGPLAKVKQSSQSWFSQFLQK